MKSRRSAHEIMEDVWNSALKAKPIPKGTVVPQYSSMATTPISHRLGGPSPKIREQLDAHYAAIDAAEERSRVIKEEE